MKIIVICSPSGKLHWKTVIAFRERYLRKTHVHTLLTKVEVPLFECLLVKDR